MPDADEALAATAVALNEDAKASRKASAKKAAKAGAAPATSDDAAGVNDALADLGTALDKDHAKYDLTESAHQTAIERMEQNATDFVIDERSLVPDVRDFLLQNIKDRPKPWAATSNAEQQDVAGACEHAAVELVRKVVEAIRSSGATDPIRCLLVGFADKGDDIKVDLKVKAIDAEDTLKAVMSLHKA